MIRSARLNGHDAYAYLKDVLTRLPTQRASEIDQLPPHQWSESRSNWTGDCSVSNRAAPSDG